MKLRNKKTGKIVEWENPLHYKLGRKYHSIKEFVEEWEDYEEPKDGRTWFLDFDAVPGWISYGDNPITDHCYDDWNELGICFETKEEAEKAVEKLKAWKRLKDKGFRFERWLIGGEYGNTITFSEYIEYNDETRANLDLLFGGEQ